MRRFNRCLHGRNPAMVLAEQWHSGQASALYAFLCGARDFETLKGAVIEFQQCANICNSKDEARRLIIAAQYVEGLINGLR